jgi:hypothetical protein
VGCTHLYVLHNLLCEVLAFFVLLEPSIGVQPKTCHKYQTRLDIAAVDVLYTAQGSQLAYTARHRARHPPEGMLPQLLFARPCDCVFKLDQGLRKNVYRAEGDQKERESFRASEHAANNVQHTQATR